MNPRGRPKGPTISADDHALFHEALKDAKPLKKRHTRPTEPPKPLKIFNQPPHAPKTPAYNEIPAPAIGGHEDAHLRRGRLDPEARLDLHGMTQDGAYRTLIHFLFRAQMDGKRLVLVITGKGGALRAQFRFWLGQSELQPVIAGVSEAHVRHGGAGAFYVLLRKQQSRTP